MPIIVRRQAAQALWGDVVVGAEWGGGGGVLPKKVKLKGGGVFKDII